MTKMSGADALLKALEQEGVETIFDIPGGALVIAAHGRFKGTSDAAWDAKRAAIEAGLSALSV